MHLHDLKSVAYGSSLYFGVLSFCGRIRISAILNQTTGSDVIDLMKCCEDSYGELKAALENVHENEPPRRPDMTPLSAVLVALKMHS